MLQVAHGVIECLSIRPEPVYRLKVDGELLELGPVLGLLLGNRNHWYTSTYLNRESERVTEVYPHTGGPICAFSPRNVSLVDQCAYGLFYNPHRERWAFGRLPLPSAIHRRSFRCDQAVVDRLRQKTGAKIFNARRYDKWDLYTILQQDSTFRQHLPETVRVTDAQSVLALLERHPRVVLKPADLSRGRGILFVERGERSVYHLTDCRASGPARQSTLRPAQLSGLVEAQLVGRRYLCQQRINLARINGAPFDVRVVMQRSPRGDWRCQGIECRVAGFGHILTNITQGGYALHLEDAAAAAFGPAVSPAALRRTVVQVSERLCHLLDATGELFGEFGVDIGLDEAAGVWLIENNVVPTFKGFLSLDHDLYRRLLAAPLLYANFLAGFGGEDIEGTVHD